MFCSLQAFVGKSTVDAGSTLKLQMLNFANPSGRDYSGSCCDAFCWSDCDTIFRFSLDRGNRYTHTPLSEECAVSYFKVGHW